MRNTQLQARVGPRPTPGHVHELRPRTFAPAFAEAMAQMANYKKGPGDPKLSNANNFHSTTLLTTYTCPSTDRQTDCSALSCSDLTICF